jgi:hypothetical protein
MSEQCWQRNYDASRNYAQQNVSIIDFGFDKAQSMTLYCESSSDFYVYDFDKTLSQKIYMGYSVNQAYMLAYYFNKHTFVLMYVCRLQYSVFSRANKVQYL